MYLILPETEGRTLEDIEMYFSNKKRNFFDIHIEKVSNQKKSETHQECSHSDDCTLIGDNCHNMILDKS